MSSSSAHEFFPSDVWSGLSNIEKTRYNNVYQNYNTLSKLGINTKPPEFIKNKITNTNTSIINNNNKRKKKKRRRRDSDESTSSNSEDDSEWTPTCTDWQENETDGHYRQTTKTRTGSRCASLELSSNQEDIINFWRTAKLVKGTKHRVQILNIGLNGLRRDGEIERWREGDKAEVRDGETKKIEKVKGGEKDRENEGVRDSEKERLRDGETKKQEEGVREGGSERENEGPRDGGSERENEGPRDGQKERESSIRALVLDVCMSSSRLPEIDPSWLDDILRCEGERESRCEGESESRCEGASKRCEGEKRGVEGELHLLPSSSSSSSLRRNPRRRRGTTGQNCYTVDDGFPKEDDFIYCVECCHEWEGECPQHPLTLILDNPVVRDGSVYERACLTTPWPLSICPSKIPGAGLGVWTNAELPKALLFGPYQGHLLTNRTLKGRESGYGWKLRGVGHGISSVDALDTSVSNWMRYVNCPRTHNETNLSAFQYKGEIYYRTLKTITRGSELMVWYGDDYAKELGLSLEEFKASQPTNKQQHRTAFHQLPTKVMTGNVHPQDRPPHLQPTATQPHKDTVCRNSVGVNCSDQREKNMCVGEGQLDVGNTVQRNGTEKLCECSDRGQRLNQLDHMKRHRLIHTGEKPYQCPDCGQRFTWLGSMKRHRLIHTGEKPHECPDCGRRFNQIGNMKRHRLMHTGEKPLECPDCGQRFTWLGSMKRHILIHIGMV